jgi:hypothetical protein
MECTNSKYIKIMSIMMLIVMILSVVKLKDVAQRHPT